MSDVKGRSRSCFYSSRQFQNTFLVLGLVVAVLGLAVKGKLAGGDIVSIEGSTLVIVGAVMFAAGGATIDVVAALKGKSE
jgi:hypothetical protein